MSKFSSFFSQLLSLFTKMTFTEQLMKRDLKGIHVDSEVGISLSRCFSARWAEPIHCERYAVDCKPVLVS